MIFRATDAQGDVILQETYYSIGGGFVMTQAELDAQMENMTPKERAKFLAEQQAMQVQPN